MTSTQVDRDYLSRIRRRGTGGESGVPGFLHDKARANAFVHGLGVATSATLASFAAAEEIDLSRAPESFVLKPTFSSSSYGVMVLDRRGDGFYDHLRHRELTTEEIVAEQARLGESSGPGAREWLVEERVVDVTGADVPDDWKFYCFQGRVGLIHRTVRRRPKNLHTYFTGEFEPIAPATGGDVGDIWLSAHVEAGTTELPVWWDRFLRIVRRVSVAVPSPFVRVDMYAGQGGPVFGEFTLVPGTFYYENRERLGPALSDRMGQLWAEAERDLA